jgi:hypothetical protein
LPSDSASGAAVSGCGAPSTLTSLALVGDCPFLITVSVWNSCDHVWQYPCGFRNMVISSYKFLCFAILCIMYSILKHTVPVKSL